MNVRKITFDNFTGARICELLLQLPVMLYVECRKSNSENTEGKYGTILHGMRAEALHSQKYRLIWHGLYVPHNFERVIRNASNDEVARRNWADTCQQLLSIEFASYLSVLIIAIRTLHIWHSLDFQRDVDIMDPSVNQVQWSINVITVNHYPSISIHSSIHPWCTSVHPFKWLCRPSNIVWSITNCFWNMAY